MVSVRKSPELGVGLALAYSSCMAFRILVVEDDAATRRGLAQLLTGAGYEVTETASMTEALSLLSTNTPDLVDHRSSAGGVQRSLSRRSQSAADPGHHRDWLR